MARARPDGYTLQVGNVSTNAIAPVLFAQKFSINYEKDVVPVARLADIPSFFIITTKDFPPRSVAEFIAYVQQNPGKIRYASPGVGSFPHFDMELLAKQNGLSMVHIPIKAGPPGYINEMVGGDIHVATINVATATPMVKAGQLRALAVNSEQRLPEYPDVPTIAEAGYPGIMTVLWAGLFAPAATPRDVLATLQQAVLQALNSPLVQAAYKRQIIRSGPTKSLDDAKSWLANEIAIWKNNMQEVKIDLTE